MKLDSKYFDSIRVKKRGAAAAATAAAQASAVQGCQWADCQKRGSHRAPKGRASEGEYLYFCREHVSEYNKSYNYFTGMDDDQLADYQRSASTGHRPTWSMGVNGNPPPGKATRDPADTLELLKFRAARSRLKPEPAAEVRKRVVQKGAKKHLLSLHLSEDSSPEEIRMQFKALVKLHHPDHNGGDRSSEDRFREIIAAYNYLKQSGLC